MVRLKKQEYIASVWLVADGVSYELASYVLASYILVVWSFILTPY